MSDPDKKEELDSFDKLLKALLDNGFVTPGDPISEEGRQRNRSALIVAMTDSEWIAQ
jgi:CRP-like cAMP-binding protein